VEERQGQRATTVAVVVFAAVVGTALVILDHEDPPTSEAVVVAAGTGVTTSSPVATTTSVDVTTTTAVAAAPTTDAGALPQTDERPTASGATFDAGVHALWEAIRQDNPELGLPFFFPQRAYLQVKAISDPAGDYQSRLIANFDDDVHTLHAQLGANASDAQFVGITVPDAQAVLVPPGDEYNKLSYWRVYGTTMQYTVDGQSGSFPVSSLISWRGEWYVVHLGAIR
jgi:hypothetical protein